jgi:ArsR family transcriptional regulator
MAATPNQDRPQDIFSLIGRADQIASASAAMAAMGHPLRLKILCLLSSGEMAVQEINEALGTTHSNISQHLTVLARQGVVERRSKAQRAYYRIADPRIVQMIALTREVFCGTA